MRPVAQILSAYFAAGGAKMDEASYQKYKLALLTDWLDREQVFEIINWQDMAGQWKQNKVAKPDQFVCKSVQECGFTTESVESAVDHLVKHFPEYFVEHGQRIKKHKGVANGTSE